MSRRGNHEGSIRKLKDGSGFRGAVRLGTDAITGKPIRKYIKRQRRDEVVAEIQKLKKKLDLNQQINGRGDTVAAYMKQWLETAIKPIRTPATYRTYEGIIRMYIIPLLGKIPLDDLSGLHVQQTLNALMAMGAERRFASGANKDGKRKVQRVEVLSSSTVRAVRTILSVALKRAVTWGKIPTNVAKGVEMPRAKKKTQPRSHTAEEAEKLLAAVKGDPYEILHVLGAIGLRRGEILGLKWTDIVWDPSSSGAWTSGKVYITRQLIRDTAGKARGDGVRLADLKTGKSRRDFPLPKNVIEALMRWQMIQEQDRIDAGEKWQDTGLVVTGKWGQPYQPEYVNKLHHAAIIKAGVSRIRFHDMRHTTATLLIREGVHPKVVSAILGHATFQFTMDTYAHVLDEMKDEATAAFNRMYEKKPTPEATETPKAKPGSIQ